MMTRYWRRERRTSVTYPSGPVVSYTYVTGASGGNLSGITATPNGIAASYTYDPYGRLTAQTIGASTDTSTDGDDAAGRLTAITPRAGGSGGEGDGASGAGPCRYALSCSACLP